ncbi:MAG TPA: AMP-binding protein, partial [Candidatus Binatia bacterium]|nr:AMP-binding protein [Candidatus Binatia bacterium]
MKSSMLMGDGLRRNAYKYPVKVAAQDRFRQVTFSELNTRVNQLAHGLLSMGMRKGDSVAVMVGNRIEHLEILFATAKIGALAIPLDIKWKALELGSVVSFFEPSVVILQAECVEEFDQAKSTQDLSFVKPVVISDLN